ncbi:MAG: dethiobiotin synthase [Leptonema sp. (in: Bacteria)]|nr:dethiobiotin synthase [Leptonema sp. (in: bacteria)]
MNRSLVVTGTDTDVGKTLVSAAILGQYCSVFADLNYYKPVQTGYPNDDDAATVAKLSSCNQVIRGLQYKEPLSPHRAAELENREIDVDQLLADTEQLSRTSRLLIEGAGGLFVPLNRSTLFIDFFERINCSVVIVARTGLGTINHTLLSVEALRSRNIKIVAIAFMGPPNYDNIETIRRFAEVPVLGPIQYQDFENSPPIIDVDKILFRYFE